MAKRRNIGGQITPLALASLLCAAFFVTAIVDIYRVARVKLRLQNIADAIALRSAAGQSQMINIVADRNEWMNRLYPEDNGRKLFNGVPPPCPGSYKNRLPILDCVDKYEFSSRDSAVLYAKIVKRMNDSQQLFAKAYRRMLDMEPGTSGSSVGGVGFRSLVQTDIPDLGDPSIHWTVTRAQTSNFDPTNPNSTPPSGTMRPIYFKARDVTLRYKPNRREKMSSLLKQSEPVGWMELDPRTFTGGGLLGARAYVWQDVRLLLVGQKRVYSQSFAYIVPGSGFLAKPSYGGQTYVRPTFYVRLGK